MKQYWKEIAALLIVKIILLTGIWYFCFSQPLSLNDKSAGTHILDS